MARNSIEYYSSQKCLLIPSEENVIALSQKIFSGRARIFGRIHYQNIIEIWAASFTHLWIQVEIPHFLYVQKVKTR